MAKTGTYALIASNTLGSNQSSVTFSSIPGTFTDLVLIFNGKSSAAVNSLSVQFNGDTASNYSETLLYGTGSAASSVRDTNLAYNILGNVYSNDTMTISNFIDYSNSTTNKTTLVRSSTAANQVGAWVNLWRSTAAITSMVLKLDNGAANFLSGSTFKLYGIQAYNGAV